VPFFEGHSGLLQSSENQKTQHLCTDCIWFSPPIKIKKMNQARYFKLLFSWDCFKFSKFMMCARNKFIFFMPVIFYSGKGLFEFSAWHLLEARIKGWSFVHIIFIYYSCSHRFGDVFSFFNRW
jgi:hypothetical protein